MGGESTGSTITLNRHTVYLLLFVAAAAFVFSTLYLVFTRTFTKLVMHVTLIMSIALNMSVSFCTSRGGPDATLSQRRLCVLRIYWVYL